MWKAEVCHACTEQFRYWQIWLRGLLCGSLLFLFCGLVHTRRLVGIHLIGRRLVEHLLQSGTRDVLLIALSFKLQPLHFIGPRPECCELATIDNLALVSVRVDELCSIASYFYLGGVCFFGGAVQCDLEIGDIGIEQSVKVPWQSCIHNFELLRSFCCIREDDMDEGSSFSEELVHKSLPSRDKVGVVLVRSKPANLVYKVHQL